MGQIRVCGVRTGRPRAPSNREALILYTSSRAVQDTIPPRSGRHGTSLRRPSGALDATGTLAVVVLVHAWERACCGQWLLSRAASREPRHPACPSAAATPVGGTEWAPAGSALSPPAGGYLPVSEAQGAPQRLHRWGWEARMALHSWVAGFPILVGCPH